MVLENHKCSPGKFLNLVFRIEWEPLFNKMMETDCSGHYVDDINGG